MAKRKNRPPAASPLIDQTHRHRSRTVTSLTALLIAVITALTGSFLTAGGAQAEPDSYPCPDVELIYARGSGAPQGTDPIGSAFVNAVRNALPGKTIDVYDVIYPAEPNFTDRPAMITSLGTGVADAHSRMWAAATVCPGVPIVLSGYSQGGAVANYSLSPSYPAELSPPGKTLEPLPLPQALDHIAAVVTFAAPSAATIAKYNLPLLTADTAYKSRTKAYCYFGDGICDGVTTNWPVNTRHGEYARSASEAADFVKSKLVT